MIYVVLALTAYTSRRLLRRFRLHRSLRRQERRLQGHANRKRRSIPRIRVTTRRRLVKTTAKQTQYRARAGTSRCVQLVPITIETRVEYRCVPPKSLQCAYIRRVTESASPTSASPDVEMRADDRHEGPVQVRPPAPTSLQRVCIRHVTEPPGRLPTILICAFPCAPTPHVKNTPLPTLSLRVLPPPRRNSNWDPDPLDVISVTSSSDSPPPPPRRRSARKSKKQTPQFMSHVLVPSLPPGTRKLGL
jgi:hypothetical protein